MAYTLIDGTFVIFYDGVASSGQPKPDGDTIKFIPRNPNTLGKLKRVPGTCIDLGADWKINVRFEAIDTLELHYAVDGGDYRQELDLAERARNRMLELLGFGHPQFIRPDVDACPIEDSSAFAAIDPPVKQVAGYILSRDADTFGRVISFVFPGTPSETDGSEVHVDEARALTSVNATLLREGLAYPTLYTSMPPDLRPVFANIAREARNQNSGVWATATMTPTNPATVNDICNLQGLVIWPKLFRRLVKYFASGYGDLSEFETWLRADPLQRDDKMLLPNGDWGNMHDMVEVQGSELQTVFQPEDVVIEPDDPIVLVEPIEVRRRRRDVRIIAVLVNPIDRQDQGKEVITLLNALPFEIDLTGWRLVTVNAQGTEKLQELGTVMNPGATLQVTWTTGTLSNTGCEIRLLNAKGERIDAVIYTEAQAACVGQTIVF